MQRLLVHGSKYKCIHAKRLRRMLAMLRGGTAALKIETGRWNGLKREERTCRQCLMGEIEDEHLLLCPYNLSVRMSLHS